MEHDKHTKSNELQQAIDLGLPSGTRWASCNVGAKRPEGIGEYFTWEDRIDAIHIECGDGWHLPTLDNIQELLKNCIHEWTSVNGVDGRLFTSKINGNSIFLPAAGNKYDDKTFYKDCRGYYWSDSPCDDNHMAHTLFFFAGNAYASNCYRDRWQSVRLVRKKRPML